MQIEAIAVQQGTVPQVRTDTQAPRTEKWYVPEHAANASHVEVGRLESCAADEPTQPRGFAV